MRFLLAIGVLVVLALFGSRRLGLGNRLPLGARLLFLTGTEYVFVGLFLGESYLQVVDHAALDGLQPFVLLGLGWVGLLFGLQFERRSLRSLPPRFFSLSLVQAIVTFGIVFAAFWGLLGLLDRGLSAAHLGLAAATLAAAAACSGPPGLAILQHEQKAGNRRLASLLRTMAGIDPLVGVLAFGLAVSVLLDHGGGIEVTTALQTLTFATAGGGLMGVTLLCLTVGRVSRQELLLACLGTVAVCGGLAHHIGASALFVGAVCGLVAGNISPLRVRLMELLGRGERLIYIVLLVLAGASWHLPHGWTLALGVAYLAIRMVGKTLGGYLATRPLARHLAVPRAVGLGLTAQAGMALAIVIDYRQATGLPLGDEVLSIAVLGIVLSELIGPGLATAVLRAGTSDEPSS